MKQIIRNAAIYVQIPEASNEDLEEEKIELERVLNPHLGKELTPEILAQLSSFIDEFKVGVNVFTDVELPPVIEKIQINL